MRCVLAILRTAVLQIEILLIILMKYVPHMRCVLGYGMEIVVEGWGAGCTQGVGLLLLYVQAVHSGDRSTVLLRAEIEEDWWLLRVMPICGGMRTWNVPPACTHSEWWI